MVFTIQRKYVLGLGKWLQELSLQGQESRNRTKFVEMLAEELKENEATRLEIVKKYAKLDDKDEPILAKKEDGTEHFEIPDEELPKFQAEFVKFLEEDFVCGGPGLKNRLEVVRDIVLNTTINIDPKIAVDYDKWCEAFEAMKDSD